MFASNFCVDGPKVCSWIDPGFLRAQVRYCLLQPERDKAGSMLTNHIEAYDSHECGATLIACRELTEISSPPRLFRAPQRYL